MSTVEANCELLTPDGWQIEIGEHIIGHGGCGARVELQQIASTTNCYVNPMLYAISASLFAAPSCMDRVSDSLVRHGVEAEIDVSVLSEGSISGALMRSLTDNNCNLLVMGCYGHSHFREIVLGGASRDMLRDLSIPVLMAH
jgi:nucleotide-binding universal stress UspA family protein